MKKIQFICFIAFILLCTSCSRNSGEEIETPDNSEPVQQETEGQVADAFLEALFSQDYEKAYGLCDDIMKTTLISAQGIETMMAQLEDMMGQYESHSQATMTQQGGMDVYDYPATFGNGRFMIKVVVADDAVSGLFFLPHLQEAEDFLGDILEGQYEAAYEMCADNLKEFFGSSKEMRAMVEEILEPLGTYGGHDTPSAQQDMNSVTYTFLSRFETGPFHMNITVTTGQVSAFTIQPFVSNDNNANAKAKREGPVASEDLPDGVGEMDIIVNHGEEHELYAKLTYPLDARGPLPAAVLVHGSGDHDMDESITIENKPFRDIAYGLSSQGIAVLRYHKVTYAYPEDFDEATKTIDIETVNDAVAAKTALEEQSGMTFSKIYVAGHSLGGMMAPRIASEGNYDGMILLAGSPRSLLDIVYDQNQYLVPINGMQEEEIAETLAQVEALYAEGKEILQGPVTELVGKSVLGFSAAYLYSIENPPAAYYIKELDIPMLILQGSKDFQVYADRDFALYREITQDLKDVTMIEYEGLNHLFMPSFMELPDTSEYLEPATVDQKVIADIAGWILER